MNEAYKKQDDLRLSGFSIGEVEAFELGQILQRQSRGLSATTERAGKHS